MLALGWFLILENIVVRRDRKSRPKYVVKQCASASFERNDIVVALPLILPMPIPYCMQQLPNLASDAI